MPDPTLPIFGTRSRSSIRVESDADFEPGLLTDPLLGFDDEPAARMRAHSFDATALRQPVSVLPARRPLVFARHHTVSEAVRAMQREHRGVVLVTEDGTTDSALTGVFTERDVLHRAMEPGRDLPALALGDVMTPDPERLPIESTVAFVLNKMSLGGFRHVPIVDARNRPVFVVSVRDVVDFLVEAFPREVLNLPLSWGADRQRAREGA